MALSQSLLKQADQARSPANRPRARLRRLVGQATPMSFRGPGATPP